MKNAKSHNRKPTKVLSTFMLSLYFTIVFYPAIAALPTHNLPGDSIRKTNSLFLSGGISSYQGVERIASPLKYSASLIPGRFGFEHISPKCIWNTSMEMAIGSAWASNFKLRSIQVNSFDEDGNQTSSVVNLGKMSTGYLILQGEYLVRTGYLLDGRFAWYNGIKIQEYLFQQGTIIPAFMNQLTINPKTSILYPVNNRITLTSSLSFTLLALNTRLNYSRDPYTPDEEYLQALFAETGFNSLNKFQRVDFSLSLQTKLGKRWTASVDYHYYWFHQSDFEGIKLYDNKLQLTFSRNFKNKKK